MTYGNDLIGDLFDDDDEQEIEILLVVNRERIVLENGVEDELNNNDEYAEFDDDEDELDELDEDDYDGE